MSIEGVDAVVFGPGDLGADMGLHGRWDDPELLAAMEGVIELALDKGVAVEAAVTASRSQVGVIRACSSSGLRWISTCLAHVGL